MEGTPRKVSAWVLLAYGALILARLFLASHDEILPWGADSATFASAATHDLWFGQERGGVAAMADIARDLGLPFKLALDAAYVTLCFLAARRIARANSEPAGLIAFFLLAFSSYFFRASIIFLSDPAAACLILAATLAFSRFVERPVSRWSGRDALVAGVVLALWALTRREELIIYASMGFLVTVIVVMQRWRWREGWSARSLLLLLPLAIMLLTGEAVRLRNIAVHHVSAQSRVSGPGSAALLSALYSIPPDREIRYCPVTSGTLEKAATVSPTLHPLLPKLLDSQNTYRLYASDRYHVPGEVCTWLNFLLHDAYGSAYSVDDGSADQAMLRTAREIRAAQAAGKIGRRLTIYPIDPLWRQWLPELPRTLAWGAWNSLGLHYDDSSFVSMSRESAPLPLPVEHDFEDGLLLRGALEAKGQIELSGVLRPPLQASRVDYVLLREEDTVIGASPVYPFTDLMHLARFNITAHPLHFHDPLTLEFYQGQEVLAGEPMPAAGARAVPVQIGVETWEVSSSPHINALSLAQRLRLALTHANDAILPAGLLCCFALAYFAARRRKSLPSFELAALALTALCFVVARLAFYSLLHVWMDWDSLRYFSASSGAALLLVISSVAFIGASLGARQSISSVVQR